MISLERGARETELAAKVDAFIRDKIIPFERDPRIEHHGPSDDLANELKALARKEGLLSPHVGEAYGGLGLNHREIATVFRSAGYSTLGPIALNIMAPDEGNMAMLEKVASAEQKEKFLRPLAAGKVRSAFLMTEPDGGAGSDPSMMKTTAVLDGNHWVINGVKTLITGADGAAFSIIMAKTGARATMFLADMKTPGIRIERVLDTIDRTMPGGHAVVSLTDVRVSAEDVLGQPDEGFKYAQVRLAPARLTHCMRWWGAAKRAHDIATAYACERQAFGKPLVDHEGVGFMLADNDIDLKQAELTIDWCAWVLDNAGHGAGTAESSVAKVAVSEALYRIADRCVQILGGRGVTDDTPVHQIFRDIRAFRIYDGPSEVHRWSIAKRIKREHKAKASH
ncbi:MAG: acyl-CoA dehydrogenase family protein [Hyphomonadaceae bacterium]|nr:acyl-CoA dehydrogenase family protein [Hyphomonadaceae bacterium]